MKNIKRIFALLMVCAFITVAFTACHSHSMDDWKIDKESHWKECKCGEISEKSEHSFELDICTVCGAERKTEDGKTIDLCVYNEYGDWIQSLTFDENEELFSEAFAEYTYDKNGNKLTEARYSDGELDITYEYEYDSNGLTYVKYATEPMEDGARSVVEYNEQGDNLGCVIYDKDDNVIESYRSEYVTDENGELIGERVYVDDFLSEEIKYAAGTSEEEEYLYMCEKAEYSSDGSKTVEIYDEAGDTVQELAFGSDGEKIYCYDLEYFYDDEGNLISVEKRENGRLEQEIIYEYDNDSNLLAEKIYEGNRLVKESQYTAAENFSYESKVIIYNEDGTTTITEYGENGDIIE